MDNNAPQYVPAHLRSAVCLCPVCSATDKEVVAMAETVAVSPRDGRPLEAWIQEEENHSGWPRDEWAGEWATVSRSYLHPID